MNIVYVRKMRVFFERKDQANAYKWVSGEGCATQVNRKSSNFKPRIHGLKRDKMSMTDILDFTYFGCMRQE